MPNLLAWLALGAWPLVALGVYATRRSRGRMARTTAWMMILPVMFLPSGLTYKVPGVPYLDKHRLSFLSIALALQLFHRGEILGKARWHNFPRLVFLALLLGVIETVRTNGDVLKFGPTVLPGLTSHDTLSISAALFLDFYLPFAVGQRVYRTEQDLRDLLQVLTTCGLIYAPLCLVELRFSPQLHYWLYGYYPTQFLQAVREGGFRPIVFMNHGLSVAMFWFSCVCAAIALRRVHAAAGPLSANTRATVTVAFLMLSKSLASICYSAVAALIHFTISPRKVGRIVAVLAILIAVYPAVRISNAFPTDEVVGFFARINAERADSLLFRFRNEDALIERAKERPLFGWGTFGRNRVYTEWGKDVSITDGAWIILLGAYGIVGLAAFGSLMLVPLLRFAWRCTRMPATSQVLLGMLALIVVVFTIDLFPNSLSDYLPLAYAGALYTLSGRLRRPRARKRVSGSFETPATKLTPVAPSA